MKFIELTVIHSEVHSTPMKEVFKVDNINSFDDCLVWIKSWDDSTLNSYKIQESYEEIKSMLGDLLITKKSKLKEISERCANLPDLDSRSADEIIGDSYKKEEEFCSIFNIEPNKSVLESFTFYKSMCRNETIMSGQFIWANIPCSAPEFCPNCGKKSKNEPAPKDLIKNIKSYIEKRKNESDDIFRSTLHDWRE